MLELIFEKYSDVKQNQNFELSFENSTREFCALLKVSLSQFPPKLRNFLLSSKNLRVESLKQMVTQTDVGSSRDIYASTRPSIDPEIGNLSGNLLPALLSNTPLVTNPKAQTVGTMAEVKPVVQQLRSEPTISVEMFPRKCSRKYTLVLDLDETLIHFKNDVNKPKFLIRPYAYNFLKNVSQFYEIIIFTAAQKEYADWILDKIDSKNNIVYRLYRDHCQMTKNSHLKDLRLIGRDMSKIIIVDNFAENFALHKENGICIRSWYGDLSDQVLITLEQFLVNMAEENVDDIRPYMKKHIENNAEKGFFIVH